MWPAPVEGERNSLLPADLWVYGHTHQSEDITIGHTRVVSNAKGYGPWVPQHRTWDNSRFDPNFVIEIWGEAGPFPIKKYDSSSQIF